MAEAPLPAEETAEDATSQREHAFRNIRFDFPGSVTVSGDMVQLAWGEDAVGTLSAIERGENLDRYEQEEDPFLMEMYLENIETDDRIFPPRLDDISVAGLPGRSASMAYQVEGRAYPATLLSFCDDEWYYCMIWVSAETDPEIASASMDVFLDMVESIVLV